MTFEFSGNTYRIILLEDRPFILLETETGDPLAELFALSSVHPLNGRDDTPAILDWERSEMAGVTTFTLQASSTVWSRKIYRLCCYPNRLTFQIEVEGSGRLAEVDYFGGYYSGDVRWGSGFFWSGQNFRKLFNFEPNDCVEAYSSPEGNSSINMTGLSLPGRGDWFYTPPPFCFAAQTRYGWLSLAAEARPGQYQFTEYAYHGQKAAFYLSLAYEGYQRVEGRYILPMIGIDFADNEYAVLKKHVRALSFPQASDEVGSFETRPSCNQYGWWKSPLFCGWGAQSHLASVEGGQAPDFSRQEHYEDFLESLQSNEVNPGIVVLDDKWQTTYGENIVDKEKWPNVDGFIARQHAQGRKILFWIKAWDPEGLPVDECIHNSAGQPVACDPTNPIYQEHLGRMVERMLSIKGYNADGFKIDFTARIPSGPGMQLYGDRWGLELLRTYLEVIYKNAKRIKPDALIMTHTPHPYLADLVDMIRLNDINSKQEIIGSAYHRARVAAIACPQAVIDTDNWPMPDKATWRRYLLEQPRLGIPSLYYATHIDATGEPLEEQDYQLIRETWRQFRNSQGHSE